MAKGVSIKFKSYSETIPRFLELIKLNDEIKKHDKIVLKPCLVNSNSEESNTRVEFVEEVLKFCLANKEPSSKIVIAEGSDGEDTMSLFDKFGYRALSEKYSIGLVDLNSADVESVEKHDFQKFDEIMYPKILLESFVISLPMLAEHPELEMTGSMSNMLGAFPSSHYKGFFAKDKSRIKKWAARYSIHDILKCKVPEFAIADASDKGYILAGQPLDVDKQLAKLLGKGWKAVSYIRLVDESFGEKVADEDASLNKVVSTE